jgi:hypothetical protein
VDDGTPTRGVGEGPVEPLHAQALPQLWGAAGDAGDDVDGPADAHHQRHAERFAEASEPLLFAGRAHRHEQDVRLAGAHLGGDRGAFVLGEVPVVGARHGELWVALVERGERPLQDILVRAEDVYPVAGSLGQREQLLHQVHAGDSLGEGVAEQARGPHDGLAVGVDEMALFDHPAQLRLRSEGHQLGRVDRDVLGVAAPVDRRAAVLQGVGQVEAVDLAAEDAHAVVACCSTSPPGSCGGGSPRWHSDDRLPGGRPAACAGQPARRCSARGPRVCGLCVDVVDVQAA